MLCMDIHFLADNVQRPVYKQLATTGMICIDPSPRFDEQSSPTCHNRSI